MQTALDLTHVAPLHAFSIFGAGPYRFVGLQTTEDRQAENSAASAAGLPFTTNMCGGACDLCGTAIWNVFTFETSCGRRFKVGCECATKSGEGEQVKAGKKAHKRERALEEYRRSTEARMEAERTANELLGHGRLTNAELADKIVADRKAAQQARRDASRYFGEVGKRVKKVELRYEGRYDFETLYGWQTLYFLRRVDTDAAVVWKTNAPLGQEVTKGEGETSIKVWEPIEKGHSFVASFTVKEHSIYKGEQQTKVSRLMVH